MLRRYLLPSLLLLAGLTLILIGGAREVFETRFTPLADLVVTNTPSPTLTNTPLYVPTRTPVTATALPATASPTVTSVPLVTPTNRPLATETLSPTASPLPTSADVETPLPTATSRYSNITYRERLGVSGQISDAVPAYDAGLNYGSFISWQIFDRERLPADVTPWQMVRVSETGIKNGLEPLGVAARANPGSIFVIGNEPDVEVQDNTTAPRYAEIYHEAYYYVKEIDPTAQIAIAGVGSPTPLRLAYLERILTHYEQTYGEKMPIDIWTMHIYVLREERNSWGIGIPTGFDEVNEGMLYEIDDHKDTDIANQLLVDFRVWLAEKGYQDTPLAITELGILLPSDYGFPPEVVSNYMIEVVNFYLSATNETGYPSDGNKLVQWWFWFILFDETGDFAVSNLLDISSGELTPIGRTYREYTP